MSSQQDRIPQAPKKSSGIYNEEERLVMVEAIVDSLDTDAIDIFTNFLIDLIDEFNLEYDGAQHVEDELSAALEIVFRRSKAYELALELYASRNFLSSGKVTVSGLDIEQMLADIKAAKLSEPETSEPKDWMHYLGAVIAKIFREDEFTEASRTSIADALSDYAEEIARDPQDFAYCIFPSAVSKSFPGNQQPQLSIFMHALGGNKIKFQLGTQNEGNVWENFEQLVRDFDRIAEPHKEAAAYTLFIFLQREDGMQTPIYSRGVPNDVINPLYDYRHTHLMKPEQVLAELVETLLAFATNPQVSQESTLKLTTIIDQLEDNKKPPELGKLLAEITRDEAMPASMRKIIREEIERLRGCLEAHNESIPPWLNLYFDQAV
jgi:hypothetical protein